MAHKLDTRVTLKNGKSYQIRHDGTHFAMLHINRATENNGFWSIDSSSVWLRERDEVVIALGKNWSTGKAFHLALFDAQLRAQRIESATSDLEIDLFYRLTEQVDQHIRYILTCMKPPLKLNEWDEAKGIGDEVHARNELLDDLSDEEAEILSNSNSSAWVESLVELQARCNIFETEA